MDQSLLALAAVSFALSAALGLLVAGAGRLAGRRAASRRETPAAAAVATPPATPASRQATA